MDLRGLHDGIDEHLGPESQRERISRLENEVEGWKKAAKKEGIIGLVMGSSIALWVGVLIGTNL